MACALLLAGIYVLFGLAAFVSIYAACDKWMPWSIVLWPVYLFKKRDNSDAP